MTRQCLEMLAKKLQTGEIAGPQAAALREKFAPILQKVLSGRPDAPLYLDAAALAATLKDPAGLEAMRKIAAGRRGRRATGSRRSTPWFPPATRPSWTTPAPFCPT